MNEEPKNEARPEGAFFTPKEAVDAVMGNPPFGAGRIPLGAEPWRHFTPDSVGIRKSARLVQAWVVREGASVDVRSERVGSQSWTVAASVDCEKVFTGVIFHAGVRRANAVVKALRNALLSARLRGRHYRMNRAARAAAAAVAASESGQQAGSGKEGESHV